MESSWRRTVEPVNEPVTTAQAKAHLRVEHSADDDLIDALVMAARQRLEEETGRAWITQTWQLTLLNPPAGRAIRLPRPPLISVTSVTYRDADGDTQTLAGSDYQVVTQVSPGLVWLSVNSGWPSGPNDGTLGLWTVTYTAGWGATAATVPGPLVQALLLLVGHLYENREAVVVGSNAIKLPMAVDWLVMPFRLARQEYP